MNNGNSNSKDICFYAEILSIFLSQIFKENFVKFLIACIWIVKKLTNNGNSESKNITNFYKFSKKTL